MDAFASPPRAIDDVTLPPLSRPFPQTTKRAVRFLFVRGDAVTLVSPPLRT